MFEIYREASYDRRFRVVYFAELDEHTKDLEIARATAGEHYYDGFLRTASAPEAKRVLTRLLERLNAGEAVPVKDIELALVEYLA